MEAVDKTITEFPLKFQGTMTNQPTQIQVPVLLRKVIPTKAWINTVLLVLVDAFVILKLFSGL